MHHRLDILDILANIRSIHYVPSRTTCRAIHVRIAQPTTPQERSCSRHVLSENRLKMIQAAHKIRCLGTGHYLLRKLTEALPICTHGESRMWFGEGILKTLLLYQTYTGEETPWELGAGVRRRSVLRIAGTPNRPQ